MLKQSEPDEFLKTRRQADISVMLIIGIVIMSGIYMTCTYNTENEMLFLAAAVCPILTILSGIYTFTYRGKAYLASRIAFFIFLILSILGICALAYVIELSKAFAH